MADRNDRRAPTASPPSGPKGKSGPEQLAESYDELRRDLIRFLGWGSCADAEEIADEAIYRGMKKMAEGAAVDKGGARGFIFGIAKYVRLEKGRKSRREVALDNTLLEQQPAPGGPGQTEAKLTLEARLRGLADAERDLLIRYLNEDDHAELAREKRVTPGHLRLMIHRIKQRLRLENARSDAKVLARARGDLRAVD